MNQMHISVDRNTSVSECNLYCRLAVGRFERTSYSNLYLSHLSAWVIPAFLSQYADSCTSCSPCLHLIGSAKPFINPSGLCVNPHFVIMTPYFPSFVTHSSLCISARARTDVVCTRPQRSPRGHSVEHLDFPIYFPYSLHLINLSSALLAMKINH